MTVQVDLDGRTVRILATGCLTEASQRGLHPLIRRARTLTPGVRVTVDCTGVDHVEAAGVVLLRQTVDHDENPDRLPPVELLLPDPLPAPETPAEEAQQAEADEARGDVSAPAHSLKVVSAHATS
ncbi:hypothetical protein [Kocuria arenosa]|uniref:hypothetical protein n=1 Tax=Kocuria arenosa TaxID=3071446 RepID=UPI0034D629FB